MKTIFSALALVALLPLAGAQTPAAAPKPAEKAFSEKSGSLLAAPTGALGVTPAGVTAGPLPIPTGGTLTFTPTDASSPIAKKDGGAFVKRHEGFLARAKAGPIGVLFLGDSITDGWSKAPHIWERYYGKLEPANFGISGDTTQNVIWRIENGELDGIHPKVVVLMIGTNNSASHTAAEIAAADKKIVAMIRAKIPETKVLLLAIFPRGARKDVNGVVPERVAVEIKKRVEAINGANAELAQLDDGVNVRYLDIGKAFLADDGTIPSIIMRDQLHPNAAGYQLWAEAMQPLLTEMLK